MTDDREALGRAAFAAHVSGLAEQDEPPWQDGPPTWGELGEEDREFYMRIGAAVAAAERARIRDLADRNNAVCVGDEGTTCYFSALLAEPQERSDEKRDGRG